MRRVRSRLRPKLADERSDRVVFLSHCLLNQNTRYPGGAFRAGAVMEVVEPYLRDGAGICQMPCPEQAAWGGVGKRYLVFGRGRPRLRPLARCRDTPAQPFSIYHPERLPRAGTVLLDGTSGGRPGHPGGPGEQWTRKMSRYPAPRACTGSHSPNMPPKSAAPPIEDQPGPERCTVSTDTQRMLAWSGFQRGGQR